MKIVNKYTHEPMYVRCGRCPACLAHKSNVQCAYISNMASHFRYAYFFTLTYDNRYVPKVRIVVQENMYEPVKGESREDYLSDCYSPVCSDPRHLNPRASEYSVGFEYIPRSVRMRISPEGRLRILDENYVPYVYTTLLKKDELENLLIKANGTYDPIFKKVVYPKLSECPDTIPVLNHTDQQLFMKRLRFYLSEITDEKISYYIVSEYGPQTYRPHWHGILFFNSPKIAEVVCQLVPKAWTLGRADISLSRGSAAGYVASYINSYTSIHDIYKECTPIKPRSYHSKGFGSYSKFRKSAEIQEIECVTSELLDGFSEPIGNGKFVTVTPSRAYQRAVFPRFSDPAFKDSYRRVNLFTACFEAPNRLCRDGYISIDELGKISLYEVSKRYTDWYYSRPAGFSLSYADSLIFSAARLQGRINGDEEQVQGKIYRLFSMVRRTLRFWKMDDYVDTDSLYTIMRYSDKYWKQRDLKILSEYYEYQELTPESVDFIKSRTVGSRLYTYDPVQTDSSCEFLSSIKSRLRKILKDKIKHKEYNDLSGLLLNFNL